MHLTPALGSLPHSAVMEANPPYTKGFQLRADILLAVPSPLNHRSMASNRDFPGHKRKDISKSELLIQAVSS